MDGCLRWMPPHPSLRHQCYAMSNGYELVLSDDQTEIEVLGGNR